MREALWSAAACCRFPAAVVDSFLGQGRLRLTLQFGDVRPPSEKLEYLALSLGERVDRGRRFHQPARDG